MDDTMAAIKLDKHGMPQYSRPVVRDGKEFDLVKAKALGVPSYARLDVPMDGTYTLREIVAEIDGVLAELRGLCREQDAEEVYLLMCAHRAIRRQSEKFRSRRWGKK